MAPFSIISDVCGHVDLLTNESVSQCEIESIFEFLIAHSHQIIKTLGVLRGFKRLLAQFTNLLANLVHTDEGCTSESILSQVIDAVLTNLNSVNDYEVQVAARC